MEPWILPALAAARMLGLLLPAPFLSIVPWRIRFAFSLAVAAALYFQGRPGLDAGTLAGWSPWGVLLALGGELVLGAVLGWGASLVWNAALGVSAICADQLGLPLGPQGDLNGGHEEPALASFYGVLGLAVLSSLDLHHLVLRLVGGSLELLPPGGFSVDLQSPALFQLVNWTGPILFQAVLVLGLPILSVMLLATAAQGVLNKLLPEADYFAFGPPLRVAIGLGTACLSLPVLATTAQSLFHQAFESAPYLLGAAAR